MTQKRILRAKARTVARERDLLMRDAFRAYWADIDDPDAVNIVSRLAQDQPDDTALKLFGMVNQLIDQVAEQSGDTREVVLSRLEHG